MEKYRKVKDIICKRNPRFQLDQISFISYCDYAIQDRYIPELNYKDINKHIECMNELKDNDTVFIDYHLTQDKINLILSILRVKGIKLNFLYLEEPIPNKQIMEALVPFAHNLYALNNIYTHPSIHSLFLGPYPSSIGNLLKEKDIVRKKEYLCLLEFQMGTAPRNECLNILGNQSFITNLKNQSKNINDQPNMWECNFCSEITHLQDEECPVYQASAELLKDFHVSTKRPLRKFSTPNNVFCEYKNKAYFMLSPEGMGQECHTFWESLFLNCVPIVKRTHTYFDKNFENLPCLIVNSWSEVTEDLLETLKIPMQERLKQFNEENPEFFTDLGKALEYYKENI
jgi:hypothetical protein